MRRDNGRRHSIKIKNIQYALKVKNAQQIKEK